MLSAGCLKGPYHHPPHVERLSTNVSAPNLPVTLELCSPRIPNDLDYTVGTKGDEDMLGVAVKVMLDPDPKKHVKVLCL